MAAAFAAAILGFAGCASTLNFGSGSGQLESETEMFTRGAVAADHHLASLAGLEMLRQGGNAVDAAVATAFTLSVARPYSSGIGGGGFMVISFPEQDEEGNTRCVAINYREVAPAVVTPDHYRNLLPDASQYGAHAVAVPGAVAGLLFALEAYGTLDRAIVLAPAIRAAEEGVAVDENFVAAARHLASLRRQHAHLRQLASGIWRDLCFSGRIKVGDVVRQPAKARALRLIAEHGASAFYQGEIADAIIKTLADRGGVMTRDDLARYTIDVTEPLRGRFLDYELLTMPPPSSGGIALQQILGIVQRQLGEPQGRESLGFSHNSTGYVHIVAEAMKHAFADRAEYLADPLFVDVPVERLTSASYIDELAARIHPERTLDDPFAYGSVTPANSLAPPAPGGTSHFSVIDFSDGGMAVAVTETINLIYGSLVYVEEFGIVLNNEMDDFTTIQGAPNAFGLRQSDRNVPEPGKRPLSSMSPTIVLDASSGRPALILGASGGPRIITAVAQGILNSVLFDMPPQQAVNAARFHHQWMPNMLQFEYKWQDESLIREMERYGHETSTREDVGVMQMIAVDEEGVIRAKSDPRKGGRAAGW